LEFTQPMTLSQTKLRTTRQTGSYNFLRSTESIRAVKISVSYRTQAWGA
jgi:hypothetical protein